MRAVTLASPLLLSGVGLLPLALFGLGFLPYIPPATEAFGLNYLCH